LLVGGNALYKMDDVADSN